MNKSLQWKLLGIILITAVSVWMILPPFTVKDKDGQVVQKGKINLGLDLQGGMRTQPQIPPQRSNLRPGARLCTDEAMVQAGRLAMRRQARDSSSGKQVHPPCHGERLSYAKKLEVLLEVPCHDGRHSAEASS